MTVPPPSRPRAGFTLIEVLLGLALVALLALMSWRGLDGMLRGQERLRERGQSLASLQTALAQWDMDLQQAAESPYLNAIAWDGRQLRIVRRSVGEPALVVVAWGDRRAADGRLYWRRWQSAPLRDRAALLRAWSEAAARLDGEAAGAGEPAAGAGTVTLLPIEGWQVLFHQGAGWAGAPVLAAPAAGAVDPQLVEPPAAVRLRLQLAPGAGLAGTLELDWANPGQNRGRS